MRGHRNPPQKTWKGFSPVWTLKWKIVMVRSVRNAEVSQLAALYCIHNHNTLLWTGKHFSEIENESETRSEIMGKTSAKLPMLSHDAVTHNGWHLLNFPVGSFRLFPPAWCHGESHLICQWEVWLHRKGKQNALFSSVGELQPCLMCRKLKFDEVNLAKKKLFREMLTEWDGSKQEQ